MNARPRRGRLPGHRDDSGITLLEVVVAMSIMTVFMAMFTAAIVQVYRVTNSVEAAATAQSQIHIAFQRLDLEIRYADGISTPGNVGADSYVEYLTTNTDTETCTQLRWRAAGGALPAQLLRRTWSLTAPPSGPNDPAHPWRPLATGLTPAVVGGAPVPPFTLQPAAPPYTFPTLRLRLAVQAGADRTSATRQSDVTFTALNTTTTSQVDTCAAERPAA
jgi:type II secretory pathway pseudopilin PulG